MELFNDFNYLTIFIDIMHSLNQTNPNADLSANIDATIDLFKDNESYLNIVSELLDEDDSYDIDEIRAKHIAYLCAAYYVIVKINYMQMNRQAIKSLSERFASSKKIKEILEVSDEEADYTYTDELIEYLEKPSISIDDLYEAFYNDDDFTEEIFTTMITEAMDFNEETFLDSLELLTESGMSTPYFRFTENNDQQKFTTLNKKIEQMINALHSLCLCDLNNNNKLANYALYQHLKDTPILDFIVKSFYFETCARMIRIEEAKNDTEREELINKEELSDYDIRILKFLREHTYQEVKAKFAIDDRFAIHLIKRYLYYSSEDITIRLANVDLITSKTKDTPKYLRKQLFLEKFDMLYRDKYED